MSHLTQVRGLKHYSPTSLLLVNSVAPHAGAWVETYRLAHRQIAKNVAPHAGAWIETTQSVKGLYVLEVAPHAGAWIETRYAFTL